MDLARQILLAGVKIARKQSLNQFYWLDGQSCQSNQLKDLTVNSDEKVDDTNHHDQLY